MLSLSCSFKNAPLCTCTVKLNLAREIDYWCINKWPFHVVHYSVVTPPLSLFCTLPLFKPLTCTQMISMTSTLPFMGVFTFFALLNFLDHYPIWTSDFPSSCLIKLAAPAILTFVSIPSTKPLTAKPRVNHAFCIYFEPTATGLSSTPL